jgi:hypothetical protein
MQARLQPTPELWMRLRASRSAGISLCSLLWLCSGTGSIWGAPTDAPAKQAPAAASASSSEAEQAKLPDPLEFARQHHPELAELLINLRKADKARFAAATQDLERAIERLQRVQQRTPDRYESELAIWKIESRIRLLTAQSVAGMPEVRRQELKRLILERQQIRIEQLAADRAKLAARLQKLDEDLTALQADREQQAEKEIDRLLKSVKGKSSPRPAAAPRTE